MHLVGVPGGGALLEELDLRDGVVRLRPLGVRHLDFGRAVQVPQSLLRRRGERVADQHGREAFGRRRLDGVVAGRGDARREAPFAVFADVDGVAKHVPTLVPETVLDLPRPEDVRPGLGGDGEGLGKAVRVGFDDVRRDGAPDRGRSARNEIHDVRDADLGMRVHPVVAELVQLHAHDRRRGGDLAEQVADAVGHRDRAVVRFVAAVDALEPDFRLLGHRRMVEGRGEAGAVRHEDAELVGRLREDRHLVRLGRHGPGERVEVLLVLPELLDARDEVRRILARLHEVVAPDDLGQDEGGGRKVRRGLVGLHVLAAPFGRGRHRELAADRPAGDVGRQGARSAALPDLQAVVEYLPRHLGDDGALDGLGLRGGAVRVRVGRRPLRRPRGGEAAVHDPVEGEGHLVAARLGRGALRGRPRHRVALDRHVLRAALLRPRGVAGGRRRAGERGEGEERKEREERAAGHRINPWGGA